MMEINFKRLRNKQMMLTYFLSIINIVILSSCFQKPESETYLIPKGFKGRATVIFNQPEGAPVRFENGRRIYKIPANGILLTQFNDEYGFIDHEYYYVDSSGQRTSLDIFKYEYNSDGTTKWLVNDSSKVGIFLDGTTGQYGGENEKSAPFQLFIVSSQMLLDSVESNESFKRRIRSLTGLNL